MMLGAGRLGSLGCAVLSQPPTANTAASATSAAPPRTPERIYALWPVGRLCGLPPGRGQLATRARLDARREQRLHALEVDRLRQVDTLARVATHRVERGKLLRPLDPVRDRHQAQGVRDADDGTEDGAVRQAISDPGHKRLVHLENVD